ncbi:MarR family transcriptional regulator [Longimycelium tulufanense]|uniref:MarR family transcriptional regulator n=1 Tax=Longimycelium tulufanense TaxID=907463 RepID=A0A8J3FZH8_9PSEU|nr:MarR family transcriptional regulator [Longimycelium tulufanense]GGM80509.1 MarR family transcriptional regulator [Longimycelium tulufanense]
MSEPGSRDVPEAAKRLGELGRRLGTATVFYHAEVATLLGLSLTDYKCLDFVLQAERPITAGRLAELSGLSTGAVTGVVDRLERAGYVRRVRDPFDRRKVLVEPVPRNRTGVRSVFDGLIRSLESVVSRSSPAELAAIIAFVEEMTEVFRREAAALQVAPEVRRQRRVVDA